MAKEQFSKYKRQLADKHVKVQDEWIEACIQWLTNETQNSNLTTNDLHSLIYEQWLMSDLRDVGIASLPVNLGSRSGASFLSGIYNLQVNYGFNIGVSAFSQLQNLKGLDSFAEEHSEFQDSESKSTRTYGAAPKESKATRTMLLELSDGFQTIKSVEHICCPAVPDHIAPGLKVQLKGNIPCRNGILLISPDNIVILGGTAEDLANEFNLRNIFDSALSGTKEIKDVQKDATRMKKEDSRAQISAESTDIGVQLKKEIFQEKVPDEVFKDGLLIEKNSVSTVLQDSWQNTDVAESRLSKTSKNCKGNTMQNIANDAKSVEGKSKENDDRFLLDFLNEETCKELSIKAYIVTFVSKLDVQKTSYKLRVCIDDGSAIAFGEIASAVIEKVLGFPPMTIYGYQEASESFPAKIKEAVFKCQQRLAASKWQMKLRKLVNDNSIEIVGLEECQ